MWIAELRASPEHLSDSNSASDSASSSIPAAAETPHAAWTKAMSDACYEPALLVGPYGWSTYRIPSLVSNIETARRMVVQSMATPLLKMLAPRRAVLVPTAISESDWDQAIAG